MPGRSQRAWHLAASLALAALVVTLPLNRLAPTAQAFEGCTVADEVRGVTCRLLPGEAVEGVLDASQGSATYRVDAFAPDAMLDVLLVARGSVQVSILDWRGQPLGTAAPSDGAEARVSAKLPLPGTYGVRVSADAPAEGASYRLTASVTDLSRAAQPVWPPGLVAGDGPIGNERQVIRVPRGGTPTGGVAASHILGAPPADLFSDFSMIADVQFEKIAGPAALTVRFRYEPEAGGGTGYILSLDPFGGTATLDAFVEGQRHTIQGDIPLPVMPSAEGANRLILTANGPAIRATLDGQSILETTDDRFSQGLIAVGAVTWSDPVTVTFDHIQVSTPPR